MIVELKDALAEKVEYFTSYLKYAFEPLAETGQPQWRTAPFMLNVEAVSETEFKEVLAAETRFGHQRPKSRDCRSVAAHLSIADALRILSRENTSLQVPQKGSLGGSSCHLLW